MKLRNLLTIALVSAVCAFSLSSCTKEEPGMTTKTVLINVAKSNWAYSDVDNNNYFYASVDVPELTETAFDYGMIKMYRTYDFTSNNPVQMELPYVRFNEVYNSSLDAWVFYTESVDYEFSIGSLNIYYTASDFDYELDTAFTPEAMQFRLVIMY